MNDRGRNFIIFQILNNYVKVTFSNIWFNESSSHHTNCLKNVGSNLRSNGLLHLRPFSHIITILLPLHDGLLFWIQKFPHFSVCNNLSVHFIDS